ncbi:hypothetical protein HY993_01365 [Candidatus Micrarchaeota archaeon]|nr:hypothetical protein [Candidatus Micrarchaeota archaeon]
MSELSALVQFVNILLAGLVIKIGLDFSEFFSGTTLMAPLRTIGAGFLVLILQSAVRLLNELKLIDYPYADAMLQTLFILIVSFGAFQFSLAFNKFRKEQSALRKEIIKVEQEDLINSLKRKKEQAIEDEKLLRINFLKRQIDSATYQNLFTEKEKEKLDFDSKIRELERSIRK